MAATVGLVPPSAMDQEEAATRAADLRLLETLRKMSLRLLKERASELGYDKTAIDAADGAEDPKEAVIELILAMTKAPVTQATACTVDPMAEFAGMSLRDVKQRARDEGIEEDKIEVADSEDDPKVAAIQLILANRKGSSAISLSRAASSTESYCSASSVSRSSTGEHPAPSQVDSSTRSCAAASGTESLLSPLPSSEHSPLAQAAVQNTYVVTHDLLPVHDAKSHNSKEVARLPRGKIVLSVAEERVDGRTRACILHPAGWITKDMDYATFVEAPCEKDLLRCAMPGCMRATFAGTPGYCSITHRDAHVAEARRRYKIVFESGLPVTESHLRDSPEIRKLPKDTVVEVMEDQMQIVEGRTRAPIHPNGWISVSNKEATYAIVDEEENKDKADTKKEQDEQKKKDDEEKQSYAVQKKQDGALKVSDEEKGKPVEDSQMRWEDAEKRVQSASKMGDDKIEIQAILKYDMMLYIDKQLVNGHSVEAIENEFGPALRPLIREYVSAKPAAHQHLQKFSRGDRIEVWSDSQKLWVAGEVGETFTADGHDGGMVVKPGTLKVLYSGRYKYIAPDQIEKFLRKASASATVPGAAPPLRAGSLVSTASAKAEASILPDDRLQWMWGDAGWLTHEIAEQMKYRWSDWSPLSQLIDDLTKVKLTDRSRPVQMKNKRTNGMIYFDNVPHALLAMREQVFPDSSSVDTADWHVLFNHGLAPMDKKDSALLESYYRRYGHHSSVTTWDLSFDQGHKTGYTLNFQTMTQTNRATSMERRIERMGPPAFSREAPIIVLLQVSPEDTVKWCWRDATFNMWSSVAPPVGMMKEMFDYRDFQGHPDFHSPVRIEILPRSTRTICETVFDNVIHARIAMGFQCGMFPHGHAVTKQREGQSGVAIRQEQPLLHAPGVMQYAQYAADWARGDKKYIPNGTIVTVVGIEGAYASVVVHEEASFLKGFVKTYNLQQARIGILHQADGHQKVTVRADVSAAPLPKDLVDGTEVVVLEEIGTEWVFIQVSHSVSIQHPLFRSGTEPLKVVVKRRNIHIQAQA